MGGTRNAFQHASECAAAVRTRHALDELVGFGVADHEVLQHAAGQAKVEVLARGEAAHAVP